MNPPEPHWANPKPCPFCGDTRTPDLDELTMHFDPPNLHVAACQCCGAQGPVAANPIAAQLLWDHRPQPGDPQAFTELADRIADDGTTAGAPLSFCD